VHIFIYLWIPITDNRCADTTSVVYVKNPIVLQNIPDG
jgi:hypothetical protein